jgi:hypothetical protein
VSIEPGTTTIGYMPDIADATSWPEGWVLLRAKYMQSACVVRDIALIVRVGEQPRISRAHQILPKSPCRPTPLANRAAPAAPSNSTTPMLLTHSCLSAARTVKPCCR